MSNLVNHARYELELMGEEPATINGYLRVIQAFADMGHSGGSAMVAIPIITRLLNFQPLSEITNNPAEWNYVGEDMWQNTRDSQAFSDDGGKTHWHLKDGSYDGNTRVVYLTKEY